MKNNKPSQANQADQGADKIKLKDEPISDQSEQKTELTEQGGFENTVEPTRFGDWEIAGRCVDF